MFIYRERVRIGEESGEKFLSINQTRVGMRIVDAKIRKGKNTHVLHVTTMTILYFKEERTYKITKNGSNVKVRNGEEIKSLSSELI